MCKTDPKPALPPYSGTVYKIWNKNTKRWYAHIKDESGNRIFRSYARYVYETKTKKLLSKEETVDHINEDRTDDRFENLQILSPVENNTKKYLSLKKGKQFVEFECPCGKIFRKSKNLTHLIIKNKKTDFCSKECSNKFQGKNESKIIRELKIMVDGTIVDEKNKVVNSFCNEPSIDYFKKKEKEIFCCVNCGVKVYRNSIRCKSCESKKERKKKFEIKKEDLERMINVEKIPFEKIGKIFGVTGNSIRKRARKYNIIWGRNL